MRFPSHLWPQNVWTHRDRRALRPGRNAGKPSALARWRRNDRQRCPREKLLQKTSAPFRGRHSRTLPARSARLRHRLPGSGAPRSSSTIPGLPITRSRNSPSCPGCVLSPAGDRGAIVRFVMDAAHPHDPTTFADQRGLCALRGGHHYNQPLMRRFGVCAGTTRASFYFYNTRREIDRMLDILRAAIRVLPDEHEHRTGRTTRK